MRNCTIVSDRHQTGADGGVLVLLAPPSVSGSFLPAVPKLEWGFLPA